MGSEGAEKLPGEEQAPPPPSPLPLAALVALSGSLLVHSLVVTVLFPFAPLMVASFKVTEDDSKVGYYAGLLASAYFFGSLLAGPLWGCLSDTLGRKTVILIGLCSNAVLGTLFGFSVNLAMAVTLRFILGLLCTVFIAAKTSLTELCDDTNQAHGFAVFGLCWALGIILGPVVGGVLAEPVQKFPRHFSHAGIFGTFPFLLPSLAIGLLSLVGVVLCLVFLPETLTRKKYAAVQKVLDLEEPAAASVPRAAKSCSSRSSCDPSPPQCGDLRPDRSAGRSPPAAEDDRRFSLGGKGDRASWRAREGEGGAGLEARLLGGGGGEETVAVAVREGGEAGEEDDPGFFRVVFCDADTLMTGSIFCLCGFMPVAFDALFPLWSLTDWQKGGLGFTTTNLGLAQAASGISLIPITLVIYPWLVNRLGAVRTLQLSLGTGVLQAAIPLVRLLLYKDLVQMACLLIFAIRSFNLTGMAAMFILTANSVRYPKYMGAVNGMLSTVQNIVQAVAPTAVGAIFAWSASRRGTFPFDYHFAWLLLGLLNVFLLVLTCFLPTHINRRKFRV